MDFRRKKIIGNVLVYEKIENYVGYISDDHKFFINEQKLFEKVGFNISSWGKSFIFGYFKDEDKNRTTSVLTADSANVKHYPEILFNKVIDGKCLAYIGKGDGFVQGYYDLEKGNIISIFKDVNRFYEHLLYRKFFIDRVGKTDLICINIENGLTEWRFNLLDHIDQFDDNGNPSKHQFAGIRQVYNNRLYIGVRNGLYAASLVAINLEDGSFYKKWDTLPDGLSWQEQNKPGAKEYNYFNFAFGIFVPEEGKIINLRGGASYWEFDLNTEEVIKYDLSEYFDEQEIWAINKPNITKQGDHLFFGVRLKPYVENSAWVNPMKMVAFNRRTKKIDWEMPFDKGLGCGNDIRFFDDDKTMCFIGAPDSTLYIYERE